ncbi:ATP-dependent Clp protease ATP-binding subunit [Patescibacteria group bacterium]|nr:ATP-dependent Clp protease ATP-binding subunit [Patescibacteria group bacterium]
MANNLFSEKFSTHLKNILTRAQTQAIFSVHEKSINAIGAQIKHNAIQQKAIITIEHILNSAAQETGSIAAEILNKSKNRARTEQARTAKIPQIAANKPVNLEIILDKAVMKSIIKAVQISQQFSHWYIGTEHLVKGMLMAAPKELSEWARKNNIYAADLEKNIQIVLESTSKFPDITAIFRNESETDVKREKKSEILEYFGKELTNPKIQKEIDPVIGRDKEIERIINILCRRYKNNPLLLGEAGVGKTAIIEGLSKRIAQGAVPPILANKKIYTIDMGSMVAGTMYRGEFEARLKQTIEAAEKNGNTILFIDEIHNIIGAGSASGSLDAANMLKPALARGTISIIGATTLDEYKKHIEQDSALERRLQPIQIIEPTEEETKQIIKGIKHNYESFHNVIIPDEAIDTAVKLSSRYLTDKLQPDKSIDLIDEASARVKVERSSNNIYKQIRSIESELENILEQKQLAVSKERYSDAIILKEKESQLREKYESALKLAEQEDKSPSQVTAEHVANIVSSLTKIPLGKIEFDEKEKLSNLEEEIKKTIIGQNKAIEKISNLIRRSRTSVSDPNRPIASFLFLGSSGVGKTETARQIARSFFGDIKSLIRLDMSEFSEMYSVSKLIGAPAGYVGYRDSNKFTDLVRANPYSVILLDEIEKANQEVCNLLLQILEQGEITDSTGRSINFRNTIIVMTSNIGINSFNKASELGFKSKSEDRAKIQITESQAREKLSSFFRTEFLNRIDSCVCFNPLLKKDYIEIVKQYTNELNKRLADEAILVELTEKAQNYVVNKGYDPSVGARGVRKFFQDNIESEIAKMILNDKFGEKKTVTVDRKAGFLVFS